MSMRLLTTDRSRAGFMLISIALIGGTGCITASIISQARNDAYQRERERSEQAESQARLATYRAAAAGGDPAASVQLAQALVRPVAGVTQYDTAQALQLLQQASGQGYGPAEYVLGWVYITGSAGLYGPTLAPLQPERGVALLKQAASRACAYSRDTTRPSSPINVASEIGRLYLHGRGTLLEKNQAQAELWRARGALHCPRSYPAPPRYVTPAMPDALAWARLDPDQQKTAPQIADLLKAMTPEQIEAARQKERQLRQAVVESERQYPAPPTEK
jgi:hypothetical protein